jgi:hypothetical protein
VHLSLNGTDFGNFPGAAISLLKTAILAPSLTRLDIVSSCLGGEAVFESLASWSNNHKTSMLQILHVSGLSLTHNRIQHLVTALQLHTPQLKSLVVHNVDIRYNSDNHWAKILQAVSIVELSLLGFNLDTHTPTHHIMILEMLHNHPTLKFFELDICVHYTNLGCAIWTATESIRLCQLQSLHLDIRVHNRPYYGDNVSVEEENNSPDYDALVQSFASNITLTDLFLSDDILEDMSTGNAKKNLFLR